MSKAFTKESDEKEEEDLPLPHGTGGKNYITPAGAERLRAELKRILDLERPDMVKTVAWAASNGDRSENGDYLYGKKKLREMDKRIRFLTKRLEAAVIVDPATQKSDRVLFGASVSIKDEEEKKKTFRIVGIDEADAANGLISWISPVAKALLQTRQGDAVTVKTPKGEEEWEILEIRYEPIPQLK